MAKLATRGKALANRLHQGIRGYSAGGLGASPPVPVIWGVTPQGVFVDGTTQASFLAQARKLVIESQRVFRYQNTLVLTQPEEGGGSLLTLAFDRNADPKAFAHIAHLFTVGVRADEPTQSMPADRLVKLLLADGQFWGQVPHIQLYAQRPVFDQTFTLRGPGWDPVGQTLIQGPAVQPAPYTPAVCPGGPAIHRLPALLRRVLSGFCWAADADLTNAVAALLTGVLANHFITHPKPILFVDGNQEGVGKTLLVQIIGQILDGTPVLRHRYTDDDELEKRFGAQVKEGGSSILFVDNVRSRGGTGMIDSQFLEVNALNHMLMFRLLGSTATIRRPNSYLWAITANHAKATADLIDRSLPVRLRYEGGDAKDREFSDAPLDLASEERLSILGELYGMVLAWRQAGQPFSAATHRCDYWARVIGGILQVAGLGDFLANVTEAETTMDAGLQALSAVAEHVLERGVPECFVKNGDLDRKVEGKLPNEWLPIFGAAQADEELVGKPARAQASHVGQLFSKHLGKRIPLQGVGTDVSATIKRKEVRCGQKRYYFHIELPDDALSRPARAPDTPEHWPATLEPQAPLVAPAGGPHAPPVAAASDPQPAAASDAGAAGKGNTLDWL